MDGIEYWKNYNGKGMYNPSILNDFTPLFQNTRQQTALDIGCGAGATSRFIQLFFDDVFAVDIVPRTLILPKVAFFVIPSGDLSMFSDNFFDLIFCWNVTVHIDREITKKYIEQSKRLSKKYVLFQFISHPDLDRLEKPIWDSKWGKESHIGYSFEDVVKLFSDFKLVMTQWNKEENGLKEIIILAEVKK